MKRYIQVIYQRDQESLKSLKRKANGGDNE